MLFLHTSDEYYGADRMLLEMLDALPESVPAQVWLPTDLPHPAQPLCEELRRRGIAVAHVDLPIMRRAYLRPVGLFRLTTRALALGWRLLRHRPETVYCTTSAAFIAAPIARVAGATRVIGHLQEIWTGPERVVLGLLASAFDGLIAISDAVRDSTPPRLHARIAVVANGVPGPTDPPTLRPAAGDVRGTLSFLVASRWNRWKGHRTLLAAWDQLAAPGQLTVLGGPPISGESVDVPLLVRGLSRPDTVSLVGECTNPYPYFDAADVVIVPSDEPEPFGLVAIEAFARGKPVVASRGGGLSEIITDGHDGWLFSHGDVAQLTEVLSSLNPATVAAAGARARETYLARYTTDAFRQRWSTAVGASSDDGTSA
jgi:glycosyltransferase involved in cell wall biosynthesis